MAEGHLHWLLKSEPEVFSINDLQQQRRTVWEGVRNYQARNFMRDQMQVGDRILYYHSGCEPSGVAGLARVTAVAVADPTQFQLKSEFYDPKSKREAPTWVCVEIEFVAKFARIVTLEMIRATPALAGMLVIKRGQRLSVQPVDAADYALIEQMGRGA